jgi:hypothetical protein
MKATEVLLLAALTVAVHTTFAQTWMQTGAQSNVWSSITTSADGNKLAAVSKETPNGQGGYTEGGGIFISTNSGASWIETGAPSNLWQSIASSADGSKLVAIGYDTTYSTNIVCTSTNSGANWSPEVIGQISNQPWFYVTSSADGNKLAAVAMNGGIYTSTNSGITWTQTSATNAPWTSIASSADGTKLVAVANSYTQDVNFIRYAWPILTSTNSGTSWSFTRAITNSSGLQAIASSADGNRFATVDLNHIFISTNSGMTWVQTSAPLKVWDRIASSADGTKLIATTAELPPFVIYTSTNSGTTWISNTIPNQQQYLVNCSVDGNELIAVSSAGVYTKRTISSPRLNLSVRISNLALSWIIPSTNFVLQSSADLSSWTELTNQPVLNLTNLQNQVFLPPPGSNVYYRLKTP